VNVVDHPVESRSSSAQREKKTCWGGVIRAQSALSQILLFICVLSHTHTLPHSRIQPRARAAAHYQQPERTQDELMPPPQLTARMWIKCGIVEKNLAKTIDLFISSTNHDLKKADEVFLKYISIALWID
jgi:hypothetical protein